jgi:integrase
MIASFFSQIVRKGSEVFVKGIYRKSVHRQREKRVQELWQQWIFEYSKLKGWTDPKGDAKRIAWGRKYVFPVMGHKTPDSVTCEDVVAAIELSRASTSQTDRKVKTAVSQFLRWCKSQNLIAGDGPLPCDKDLLEPLISLSAIGGNQPALDWKELPRFVYQLNAELESKETLSSCALLFLILTASRLGPIRNAKWNEFNANLTEWSVPAEHMKGKLGNNKPHYVPLSKQATRLLKRVKELHERNHSYSEDRFVFSLSSAPFSEPLLANKIKRMTKRNEKDGSIGFRDRFQSNRIVVPHGFRSAFATWGQEKDKNFVIVEKCLAHKDSLDRYRGAYRRAELLTQRAKLLQEWGDYCFSLIEKPLGRGRRRSAGDAAAK